MVKKKGANEFEMTEGKGLSFIALRDHRIVCNEVDLKFVKGKSYKGIDSKWEATLKTEKIIK